MSSYSDLPQWNQQQWLKTHKEFSVWKKTENFTKWRRKQFLRQGGTCYYCDQLLIGVRQNIEHIVPKISGGSNRRSNLVIACWECNLSKNTSRIPTRERIALKKKNKAKRGTYHIIQANLLTEERVAEIIRDIIRED